MPTPSTALLPFAEAASSTISMDGKRATIRIDINAITAVRAVAVGSLILMRAQRTRRKMRGPSIFWAPRHEHVRRYKVALQARCLAASRPIKASRVSYGTWPKLEW